MRVVLVHGVRTSATMWRAQLASLRAAGYDDVVAIDLPGHGSRRGETFTLARCDEVLQEVVDGAAGPVVVVGLSLGGYVSLHWAARTATPPLALVLSSCTALPGGPALEGFIAVTHAIAALPGEGAVAVSGRAARLAVGPAAAADIEAGGISVAGQVAALTAMRGADPLADLRRIDELGTPVTFVQGEWDHFRLDERAFRAAAPHARWVLVRRAHHLVSLHRPRAYTRALLDALRAAGEAPGAHAAHDAG